MLKFISEQKTKVHFAIEIDQVYSFISISICVELMWINGNKSSD